MKPILCLALVIVSACVWVPPTRAQNLLLRDDFGDADPSPWTLSSGTFQELNQRLVISGDFGPMQTNRPTATHIAARRTLELEGPLPDGQTLELRADLDGTSPGDAFASLHFLWAAEGQGYALFKNETEICLFKFWSAATAFAVLLHEAGALPNRQVTLALSLTRSGSDVHIRTRLVEQGPKANVLFERSVTDTPAIDPTRPNRTFRGMLSGPDLAGIPWPVSRSPDEIELCLTWGDPVHSSPVNTQVAYDSVEVWQYDQPELRIQTAVLLDWPQTASHYVLQSAPRWNGPWEQVDIGGFQTNGGRHELFLPARSAMTFFRLSPLAFPDYIPFDRALGEIPEGVAVDAEGNVYVSIGGPGGPRRGEIWKYTPTGVKSVLVDFGTPGVTGLLADSAGNVYVARGVSPNNGVYRVDRAGVAVRLPGTERIVMPNAMAFDSEGNLFVTETFSFDPPLTPYSGTGIAPAFGQGGIWRIPRQGSAELWLRHDLLTGSGVLTGLLQYPAGANGIVYRDGALIVANTERGQIVSIPILAGALPGTPVILSNVPDPVPAYLPSFGPPVPDGLALDALGNIYVPIPNRHAVMRLSADSSTWTTLATEANRLDAPVSLAFGTIPGERTHLFVTSLSLVPGFSGPALVKIEAGLPGLPLP